MIDTANPHYNQKPRRKANFITPQNKLKQKMGSGGLSQDIINKAQSLIENNTYDFKPDAEEILNRLERTIAQSRQAQDKNQEDIIQQLMFPVMQLKTSGGMFHYNLVTDIADRLVQFLEVVEVISEPELEIVTGFYSTLRAVFAAELHGDGGPQGKQLYNELLHACDRYFEKFPSAKTD